MNIKSSQKKIWILSIVGLTIIGAVAIFWSLQRPEHQRKMASLMDQANPEWTNGQKLKWALTKQFNIEISEQEIHFSTPVAADLCTDNHGIALKFSATEVMISGRSPEIIIMVGCEDWLKKADYVIRLNPQELLKLHQTKDFKIEDLQISGRLIYKDDEWPTDWTLSAVEVIGPNGFEFNQFELQDALQKLLTVSIRP